MAKEILLYDSIDTWSVSDLIYQFEVYKNENLSVRVFSPGGSVYAGYGLLAKSNEHKKAVEIKVDGCADSMAFYFVANAKQKGICLDVSTFLVHRAAAPTWVENNSEYFNDAMKAELNTMNGFLRAIIESCCTPDEWFTVTGVSLDEIFSLESRVDVTLTAEQAQKLGFISEIVKLTPDKKQEIESLANRISAQNSRFKLHAINPDSQTNKTEINIAMTLAEFKAQHPALYAQIVAEGRIEGIAAEKDRAGAWMAYVDVDPTAVAEGIKSGNAPTLTIMAEMNRKALNAATLETIEAKGPKDVKTPEAVAEKTAAEKEAEQAKTTFSGIAKNILGAHGVETPAPKA